MIGGRARWHKVLLSFSQNIELGMFLYYTTSQIFHIPLNFKISNQHVIEVQTLSFNSLDLTGKYCINSIDITASGSNVGGQLTNRLFHKQKKYIPSSFHDKNK